MDVRNLFVWPLKVLSEPCATLQILSQDLQPLSPPELKATAKFVTSTTTAAADL